MPTQRPAPKPTRTNAAGATAGLPSSAVAADLQTRPAIPAPPEVFQIVVECRDEQQQRSLFERLRREGLKLRLLVL